ncbi:FAD-dependent oxidoreductase [Candidatus Micrarchaeota archaeon]|nr:FAD-dependent oxidoreductase [Candidatus Micrarchaeota archaeon]
MDSNEFDVIIVGAGPAGLSCARALKGSGLRVMVLEKNPNLGMKICSGEISPKVLPGGNIDRGMEWKELVVCTEGSRQKISYSRPFLWTIGRENLEKHLMGGCDAEIHFSEPVSSVAGSHVKTPQGRYNYKHLVGADGAFSIVRKYLDLPVEHIQGWAYHFVLDAPCPEFQLCWMPKTFPKSYGYMMSKGRSRAMAGLAWAGDFDPKKAAKARAWALKHFGISRHSAKSEAMKGNADYRGWKFGKVYLAGEAAGLLNPLTTEGIYYAVKSGEGVARDILGEPEGSRVMNSLARSHRWQVLFFDLATNPELPFCWIINWILKDPRKGIRRKVFDWVLWKLMLG